MGTKGESRRSLQFGLSGAAAFPLKRELQGPGCLKNKQKSPRFGFETEGEGKKYY